MKRSIAIGTAIAVLSLSLVAGTAAAVSPSAFDAILKGTPKDDTISAGVGRQKIVGFAGDDTLAAGKGADLINGGPGNDKMRGGGFHDKLNGGNGQDRIFGGAGNDVLIGGRGKDVMRGGAGNDTLRSAGDPARDVVDGGPGLGDVCIVDARDLVTGCETVTVLGQ